MSYLPPPPRRRWGLAIVLVLVLSAWPLATVAMQQSWTLAPGDTATVSCPTTLSGSIGGTSASLACAANATPAPTSPPAPGGTRITYVRGAVASPSSGTTATTSLAGVAAGDVLVASVNVGAGFTESGSPTASGPGALAFSRVATGIGMQSQVNLWVAVVAASGTYTVSAKGGPAALALDEYAGVNPTAPVVAAAVASGSSAAPHASAAGPLPVGALVLGDATWDNRHPTVTAGAGFTLRQAITDATMSQPVVTEDGGAGGTAISAALGLSASNTWVMGVLALAPAGTPMTPTATSTPTATPSPTATGTPASTPTPTPSPTPSTGLHVVGTQLLNASGQPVILRGVNYSGTEYACIQGWGIFDGPSDATMVQAMKTWGINAVNLGLNEDCWLGINGVPAAYGGSNYQQAIVAYTKLLESDGITPIISLFWEAPGTQQATDQLAMPDADHATALWQSVASTFKGDAGVILRLKEEPYPGNDGDSPAIWNCWLNGGSACSEGYSVVGMQALLNTVRATGATNVVQVPGIQYANSLTQFLAYQPSDPSHNLMAVVDAYGNNLCGGPSCFDQEYAPVAAVMPLMAGEFGDTFDGSVCGTTAADAIMNWFDAHDSGYDAWTWNMWGGCSTLSLITDFNGTAQSPWGTDYQAHLKAVLGLP